jgi:hypothetical protein
MARGGARGHTVEIGNLSLYTHIKQSLYILHLSKGKVPNLGEREKTLENANV